jgi:hypothetical protein
MKTFRILVGASLLALSFAFPAIAQDATQQPKADAPVPVVKPIDKADAKPEAVGTTAAAPVDNRDAKIELLMKEIEALKAAQAKGAEKVEKPAKAAAAEDVKKYTPGWISRIILVGEESQSFAQGSKAVFGTDPVASFVQAKNEFNYAEYLKETKVGPSEQVTYQNQAFFQAKEAGRYAFKTTISLGKLRQGSYGSSPCNAEVKVNNETIAANTGRVGPDGQSTLTTIGGVDLEPGLYKVEWNTYCETNKTSVTWFNAAFEVKTPSDDSPSAPPPGFIIRLVR